MLHSIVDFISQNPGETGIGTLLLLALGGTAYTMSGGRSG
ncbi:MAG: hypothetical protein QOC77_3738 [Thermoleophilaceae bacterium]|jgi:hypothetical protein|nr:hypothetical protein [Thermoleophilaceae bacterium]